MAIQSTFQHFYFQRSYFQIGPVDSTCPERSLTQKSNGLIPTLAVNLSVTLLLPICFAFVTWLVVLNSKASNKAGSITTAPYGLPLLGHSLLFSGDPSRMQSILRGEHLCNAKLFRFRLPTMECFVIRGSSSIREVLFKPHIFSFQALNSLFLKKVLGMQSSVVRQIREDDSGIQKRPHPQSKGDPSQRILYMKHKATHDSIGRTGLAALTEQFQRRLDSAVQGLSYDEQWVEGEDLYMFWRDIMFNVMADSFFGPNLRQLTPDLGRHFWAFDHYLPNLARGIPAIFYPRTIASRNKCVEALHRWRTVALKSDVLGQQQRENTWDSAWGLNCFKLRNAVYDKFAVWNESARNKNDLALLWAINGNVIPGGFWAFVETIASKELKTNAMREVKSCIRETNLNHLADTCIPQLDLKKLVGMPLLQSIFCESLRKYVAGYIIRDIREPYRLHGVELPRGSKVMISTYAEHMDAEQWNLENKDAPPLTSFWARRFLAENGTFSMRGNLDAFIPFGMGETMCPGRHFAKSAIIYALARLLTDFEIELSTPQEGWVPGVDGSRFGFGTMVPIEKTPFKIKRRRHL